ncbi:hypothetical protein D9M69_331470 [compost metagenome]
MSASVPCPYSAAAWLPLASTVTWSPVTRPPFLASAPCAMSPLVLMPTTSRSTLAVLLAMAPRAPTPEVETAVFLAVSAAPDSARRPWDCRPWVRTVESARSSVALSALYCRLTSAPPA